MLHRLLEHLSSDSKNIKKSLSCITYYIKNKDINCTKANDIPDLKSIDEIVWNFISAIYKSGWDTLVINKDNKTFKQQVASKFTSKIQKIKKSSKDKKLIDKPVSFIKLPSSISVKSSNKVNKISKYFKKNIKKKDQKNYMLRLLLLLLTLLGKLWKSRKYSLIYKIKKLKTFKKSLGVRTNPNQNSIWLWRDYQESKLLSLWILTTKRNS